MAGRSLCDRSGPKLLASELRCWVTQLYPLVELFMCNYNKLRSFSHYSCTKWEVVSRSQRIVVALTSCCSQCRRKHSGVSCNHTSASQGSLQSSATTVVQLSMPPSPDGQTASTYTPDSVNIYTPFAIVLLYFCLKMPAQQAATGAAGSYWSRVPANLRHM